jgi:hypothetical protein
MFRLASPHKTQMPSRPSLENVANLHLGIELQIQQQALAVGTVHDHSAGIKRPCTFAADDQTRTLSQACRQNFRAYLTSVNRQRAC